MKFIVQIYFRTTIINQPQNQAGFRLGGRNRWRGIAFGTSI